MFLRVIPQRREKSASPSSGSHPYQEGGIFRFPVLASSTARVPCGPNLAGDPWLTPRPGERELDAGDAGQLAQVPFERFRSRSEEHTSELQSRGHLVCRLLL